MSEHSPASNDKVLQALFTQTTLVPQAEGFASTAMENPAITADNTPTLLAHIGMGFLMQYIEQGDKHRIFCKQQPNFFQFEYKCPDLQSKLSDDDDDDWADAENDSNAKPNLTEKLDLSLSVSGMTAGMVIVFNETTGLYQLDDAFIQTPSSQPIDLDCSQANRDTLQQYLVAFSVVAKRLVQERDVSRPDWDNLRGFYKHQVKPAGPEPFI